MKKFILVALIVLARPALGQFILEPLKGVLITAKAVYIQVYSGGCTYKDSFSVQKIQSGQVQQIYLYRIQPDYCHAYFKYGVILIYSFDDLNLNPTENFRIMNPFIGHNLN